jgi:hypothetical protein
VAEAERAARPDDSRGRARHGVVEEELVGREAADTEELHELVAVGPDPAEVDQVPPVGLISDCFGGTGRDDTRPDRTPARIVDDRLDDPVRKVPVADAPSASAPPKRARVGRPDCFDISALWTVPTAANAITPSHKNRHRTPTATPFSPNEPLTRRTKSE